MTGPAEQVTGTGLHELLAATAPKWHRGNIGTTGQRGRVAAQRMVCPQLAKTGAVGVPTVTALVCTMLPRLQLLADGMAQISVMVPRQAPGGAV
jgi:hypothetical protein